MLRVDVDLAASNFESRHDPGASITDPSADRRGTRPRSRSSPASASGGRDSQRSRRIVDAETGTTDVYGDPRPQGFGNDIGADELPGHRRPEDEDHEEAEAADAVTSAAKFAFASNEPAVEFECKLDKAGCECSSPLKLKRLKPRRHTLSVRPSTAPGTSTPPRRSTAGR